MTTYRTFLRSCTTWEEFASSPKRTQERGLDLETARQRCKEFNSSRTAAQVKKGTKLEFERED